MKWEICSHSEIIESADRRIYRWSALLIQKGRLYLLGLEGSSSICVCTLSSDLNSQLDVWSIYKKWDWPDCDGCVRRDQIVNWCGDHVWTVWCLVVFYDAAAVCLHGWTRMALVVIRELTDQKGGLRSLHPRSYYTDRPKSCSIHVLDLSAACGSWLKWRGVGINMQRVNSIRILFMSKPIRKPFKKDESLSSPMYTFNAFNIQPNKEKVCMCCTQHRAPARMFRFTGRRLAWTVAAAWKVFFFSFFLLIYVRAQGVCAVFLCGSIHSPWWCEVNKSVACRVGRSRLPYTWERQTSGCGSLCALSRL